jgi:hypothetical protein
MTFDMREYRALALRTKAPVTAASRHNLVRGFEFIQEIFEEAKANAHLIDRLKRYAIYGKEDEDLVEQMLPTYPVGDKAERIIQCLDLIHALVGIIGECGEIAEALMVHIDSGEPLNINNIQEEGGDAIWFLNLMLYFCGKLDIVDIGGSKSQ